MLELRCSHDNGAGECGRFLARLEGGFLILYCPRCKGETRIALAVLVAHFAAEALELQRTMDGEGGRLLW